MYSAAGVHKTGAFPNNAWVKHNLMDGSAEVWPPAAAAHVRGDATWDGGDCFRMEPTFVPRTDSTEEEDGFVLATCHNSVTKTTTLDIFDAQNFGAGPIQRIELGELWGYHLHGVFDAKIPNRVPTLDLEPM